MSSIVNKVKDALHSDKDKQSHPHDTTGTHSSRLNEPRVDAERDSRTSALNSGATGNTTYSSSDNYATGPASNTAGPHSSNIVNKAHTRVDSNVDSRNRVGGVDGATSSYATGPASNTAGPHASNLANKADPRVDSDLDSHNRTGGFSSGPGPASNTAGPHSSNIANKADPRVDSDMDGSTGYNTRSSAAAGTMGTTTGAVGSHAVHGQQYSTSGHSGMTGASGLDGSGLNTTTGSGINTTSGTSGAGYGTGNTIGSTGTHNTHHAHDVSGTHGTTGHDGTTGHHGATGSSIGNTNTVGGAGIHASPGPAPNTAGPHKSDMMNKLDPRVDSDLDGSKTIGGNTTYARS